MRLRRCKCLLRRVESCCSDTHRRSGQYIWGIELHHHDRVGMDMVILPPNGRLVTALKLNAMI